MKIDCGSDGQNIDARGMVMQANFELGSNQFDMPSIKYTPRQISFPNAIMRPDKPRAGNMIKINKMENDQR